MSAPLVSVVIATWNAAEYLPQTLETVVRQTWLNLEIVVVDDGSTDHTADAIAPFLSRIRYERRGHRGLAAARNEAIRLATGDYVALLDADDLWYPEKLAVQVALAERHPESGLIACDAEEFRRDEILRTRFFAAPAINAWMVQTGEATRDFQRAFIGGNFIPCPAQVLMPHRVVERIGPFADSGAQDYDYYLRVSRHYPATLHRDVLVRWRFRPDSMSGPRQDRSLRWGRDDLPVLIAHRDRCREEDLYLLEQRISDLTRLLASQQG